ncbi:alpha-ketoglutarate-dependent dioxygenase AlkB family protein [Lysobacter capsici]|uniref:alpha-ketoglutarate-dependent dioxygenase AlkB family protein n=1 Tax=Lysobacter capsici TaxID=435897 RepID=UPI000BBA7F0D|nr:alpha-ketoglutarate-dependent dioxygenase AlkB [Lysobacter capsici]
MNGLFPADGALEKLPIEGADVSYLASLDLGRSAAGLLQELIDETPWRAENVFIWGKSHPQPRLIAWFGDAGQSYNYSGIKLDPLPWTPTLSEVRERVQKASESSFNSVLLNYYRDHRDSMGFHSDDEPELGERPSIASLSLGETRIFVMKAKTSKKTVRIPLESGSLLLMKGETQRNWKHGIEKLSRPCGPRVNLTFRNIRSRSQSGV